MSKNVLHRVNILKENFASSTSNPTMAAEAAKNPSKPYIPLSGLAEDGYNKNSRATATCLCGTVQLEFVSRCFNPFRRE